MRHLFTIIVSLSVTLGAVAQQPGDTVVVQTFSYSDPAPASTYNGTFQFPPATEKFQKILMQYSLKCDPSTRADRFACGEWDYLSYTFLWDSSGVYDSTFRSQQTLQYIDGGAPDSLEAVAQPTYTYILDPQEKARYNQLGGINAYTVGGQNDSTIAPLGGSADRVRRSQFIWTASELSALSAGTIDGIAFYFKQRPSIPVRNLEIRLQHTQLDSLDPAQPVSGGYSQVFRRNVNLLNEPILDFPRPFTWDGTSNLLVEISYEFQNFPLNALLHAETTSPTRAISASRQDGGYLEFDGFRDIVNCGSAPNAAISGNQARTIEVWARIDAFNNGGLFQAGLPGANDRDFSLRTTTTFERFRGQVWGPNDFDVTLPGSGSGWHHYALSYDGAVIRLYFDGELAASRAAALGSGMGDFLLGRWNNARFRGALDEARVWNTALNATDIKAWMNRAVDNTHPAYPNLIAYYPIQNSGGTRVMDMSGNGYHGEALGTPQWKAWRASDMAGFEALTQRPQVEFIQANYGSISIDTTWSVDSFPNDAVQLIEFGNPGGNFIIRDDAPNNPGTATDTLILYPANRYTYSYLPDGTLFDSTYITASQIYRPATTTWFSNVVRFEIGRYITPYGIGLDLGPEGKTWYYDVTDYAPLLHDWVRLRSGNNQELHDLKFLMIKGDPPREVKRIQNIYDGSWSFASIVNGTNARPVDLRLDPAASNYRLKTRTTGHGFGGPTNCAEFCRRFHSVNVDGTKRFEWLLWNECSFNPLPAQGGTWVYDRAGWCPGDVVPTYDWELSPFVQPGDTVNLDYEIDPNNEAAEGNWVLRSQLVSYGPPTHTLDVSIEDVLAPTTKHRHAFFNPICANPKVLIKNKGTDTLTRCVITYGVKDNGLPCYYEWTGSLGFLEEEEVELPLFNWAGAGLGIPLVFFASVSNPNFQADGYDRNNYIEVPFERPPVYGKFVIEFSTNRRPGENRWYITDANGNRVKSSALFLGANSTYNDTVDLPEGCYLFVLEDDGNDGLAFFANPSAGSGSIGFKNPNGTILKAFDPDLGGGVQHAFTVGYRLGEEPISFFCSPVAIENALPSLGFHLYPNPSNGQTTLRLDQAQQQRGSVRVFDALGRMLWERPVPAGSTRVDIHTSLPRGAYWVEVQDGEARGRKAWLVD